LYRDDPHWVPPLVQNQRELLGYSKHPFHEQAEVETFLAYRGGKVIGRIAAILNRAHNERHNERRGFFGFFESIDDDDVAKGLFHAVTQWFATRDIHLLRGPCNPSMNYECGLLVDGFDSPPMFMMTHNPPYYSRLIEQFGFQKSQDLYAYTGYTTMLRDIGPKLGPLVGQIVERLEVKLRPMSRNNFREDVAAFLDIYNRSLENTWGFVPLSTNEMKHMAASMRYLIVPEIAIMAEIGGKPVGATFGLLDYNPRIKAINGRLFPFGFLKLLRRKREIKRMRQVSTNVVPEYQRWGVGLAVLSGLVPMVLNWGIQEVEFSWVLESNNLSRGSLEKGGAELTKTFRIYDYDPAYFVDSSPALVAS
jgi:GNAT superfamily N-acetyltransferase